MFTLFVDWMNFKRESDWFDHPTKTSAKKHAKGIRKQNKRVFIEIKDRSGNVISTYR